MKSSLSTEIYSKSTWRALQGGEGGGGGVSSWGGGGSSGQPVQQESGISVIRLALDSGLQFHLFIVIMYTTRTFEYSEESHYINLSTGEDLIAASPRAVWRALLLLLPQAARAAAVLDMKQAVVVERVDVVEEEETKKSLPARLHTQALW